MAGRRFTCESWPNQGGPGKLQRHLPYNSVMTSKLQDILRRVEQMPEEEQNFLAAVMEEEIADEQRWQLRFAATPSVLESIQERAKRQFHQGLTGDL